MTTTTKPWEKMSTNEQVVADYARSVAECRNNRDRVLVADAARTLRVGPYAPKTTVAAAAATTTTSSAPAASRVYYARRCPNPRLCGNPGCDGRCGY